jgi:hypothetical protein
MDDHQAAAMTSKRTVRIVFGLTLLWIMLGQYVFLGIAREEPYPALILPGFPATCSGCLLETGEPKAREPLLFVRFSDGRTQQVPLDTILPPGPSVRLMVFTAAFTDQSIAANPDAIAWLRSKVDGQFPGRSVSGLDIVWRAATYRRADPASTTYTPQNTIHLDLGTAK